MHRDADFQERARDLRHNLTNGEQLLWSKLRAHRMHGFKFRRQHVLGSYIVDFVCLKSRLIIEVDGESQFDMDATPPMPSGTPTWRVKVSRSCALATEMC
jgi:very-short-patch-repair endonuclease